MRAVAGLALIDRAAAVRWMRSLLVADGAALTIGALAGSGLPLAFAAAAPLVGLAVLGLAAIASIVQADTFVERLLKSRTLAVGAPIVLSLDSLAAGAALGALGYPLIPAVGLAVGTSALLAVLGFAAGSTVASRRLPVSPSRLGGVALAIAVAIAVANG